MESAIFALTSRYGLSRAELIAEIESAFGLLLSRLRQQEVMVHLQDGMRLEVIAYGKRNGLPVQQVFELPALLSQKDCSAFLEERLALAAVVKQARLYKTCTRSLI